MTHLILEDIMGWIAGRITVDDCATVVDAEYRDDYRWNGWLCPRMRRDECERVLRGLLDQTDELILMVDGDAYILWDWNMAEMWRDGKPVGIDPDYEPEVIEPTEDGWYLPGYAGWCWQQAWSEPPHTAYYTSADSAEEGSTWSVYSEQFVTPNDWQPVENSQTHVSTHATEAEADAEAMRLQGESR